jgi:hypothetical protein
VKQVLAGLALAALLAAGVPAGAAELIDSAYTHFDAKHCRHMPGTEEEDYGTWLCKGFGGIAVLLAAGDQRMTVSLGPHAGREPAASETFEAFNDVYQGTIEWRLARQPDGRMRPFATILRWNVRIDADDGGHPRGRFLVVTRLGPGGVCRVGTVDATGDPDANDAARAMADAHARSFRCGEDKPNQFRD